MNVRRSILLALLPLAPAACDAPEAKEVVQPDLGAGGKADVIDRVDEGDRLDFDAPVTGDFTEDLQFFAHRIEVRDDADVRLDVTHLGTAARLDSTMFVYGPRGDDGGFGTESIAFDDDDGWGQHSRLDMSFDAGGEYLVVLGTASGRDRGHYRLLATCMDDACGPLVAPDPAQCHPWVEGNVLACFRGQFADAALDPEAPTPTSQEVIEVCTDAEALGPVYDNTCAAPEPPGYCAQSFESFAQSMGPACADALAPYAVECAFGGVYRALFAHPDLAVAPRRVLHVGDALSEDEQAQVIAAVLSASYAEVSTVQEAFEAADQHEINQILVWDKSSASPYVVYEFGAGDTSVGAYFELGSDVPVAIISDGDLERCSAAAGPLGGACAGDQDCSAGSCVGASNDTGQGRCVDISAPGGGDSCTLEQPCDLEAGLMCAGLSRTQVGMCLPAWMRGNVPLPDQALQVPDVGTVEHDIDVSGLATVDMDVEVDMVLTHPDPTTVRITLRNPDGNVLTVFDGTGGEPYYTQLRTVTGFSGDESVNGTWTLAVTDLLEDGQSASIDEGSIRLGSRWD